MSETLDIDHVVQIIGAEGWVAAMASSEPPYCWLESLVCWGLIKKPNGETFVTGLGLHGSDTYVTTLGDEDQCIGFFREGALTEEDRIRISNDGKEYAVRKGWITEEPK